MKEGREEEESIIQKIQNLDYSYTFMDFVNWSLILPSKWIYLIWGEHNQTISLYILFISKVFVWWTGRWVVIPHLRQNIIILICGLELGCEILLHWRFREEWNVVSHLGNNFEIRMMNSSKQSLFHYLKLNQQTKTTKGKGQDCILYFFLLSKPYFFKKDIYILISQFPHFSPSCISVWQGWPAVPVNLWKIAWKLSKVPSHR